jgi:hypothetical protein
MNTSPIFVKFSGASLFRSLTYLSDNSRDTARVTPPSRWHLTIVGPAHAPFRQQTWGLTSAGWSPFDTRSAAILCAERFIREDNLFRENSAGKLGL